MFFFLTSFLLVLASFSSVFAADVIDASLRMRFNFDSAPINNVIVDSSPSAAHPGTNFGASWSASEGGRSGLMHFKAPIPNRITSRRCRRSTRAPAQFPFG